ncbi:MAG: hypothetical protein WEB09_01935 [Nitriliruptor sp.]
MIGALALVATQCTAGDEDDTPSGDGTEAVEDEASPPPCDATPETAQELSAREPFDLDAVTRASFDCVEQVLLVAPGDPALAAIAAPLAADLAAPLLLGDEQSTASVRDALGDPEIRTVGPRGSAATAPGTDAGNSGADADDADASATDAADASATDAADDADDTDGGGAVAADDETTEDGGDDGDGSADADPLAVALEVADELGTDRFVAAADDAPADLAAAAAHAVTSSGAVLPVAADGDTPDLPEGTEVVTIGDLAEVFPDAEPADEVWSSDGDPAHGLIVDPASDEAAAVVALATLRGDVVVPAEGGDVLGRAAVEQVRSAELDADALVAIGELGGSADGDLDRHLTLLAEAPLVPGGSLRHFDGTRMVAMYGKPGAPVLGVLGEQDLEASFDRVREISEGYDADGREVVPTFEVIVTVASAEAGDDGQYSRVTPPEEVRELVDRAGEEGVQVILDLQPGRNHFLDQAKIYEDLLREPHVGLALDPEWRLENDQVHLQQIGSVEAAEVQEVMDWYAALARDAGLAEKLLVLHQFRVDMLPDRDTLEAPDEVAVVVHMDGQGPQGMKLETWGVLTRGAEDRWHWAWKNFYDEDPVVAEPSYILDLDPEVVLVTYQ